MRPLIGISCFSDTRGAADRAIYGANASYVRAVESAGGAPVLLPPLMADADDTLRAVAARLDGLLLSGGGDLDPQTYDEARLPQSGAPEPGRDAPELALAKRALSDGVPVFGICRGMQLLNVALGGSLYQDVPTQFALALRHDNHDLPRDHRAHEIAVQPDSRLRDIIGAARHQVNSLHHQAIARLGTGARVVAEAPDGIAEAIEIAGQPFALAVQYHPEELVASDEASRLLFAAFVHACAERARR